MIACCWASKDLLHKAPLVQHAIFTQALVGFQGRGCADGVQLDLCHFLFLEALLFQ
jgi:hypothetical protein